MLKSFSLLLIDPWNFILFYFSLDILNVILISFEGIWRAVGWFATVAYGNSWICFARDWLWNSGTHPFMFWSHIFAGKIVLLNLGRGKWSGNRLNEQCLPMKVWYALVWDWIWCFISRREGEHKQIDILTYRLNITLECVCCLLYYSNFKMPHCISEDTSTRYSFNFYVEPC